MLGILAFFKGIKISENVWKLIALVLVVGSLVGGGWTWGNNHGMAKGVKEGVDSQQHIIAEKDATIANLTKTINDNRTATNNKISSLESQAAQDAATIADLQKKAAQKKSDIARDYETKNKDVAVSCGLSTPTVDAINAILDVDLKGDSK